jgi:hypothetical protein
MASWGDFIFYWIFKDNKSSIVARNIKTMENKIIFSTEEKSKREIYGLNILSDKLYFVVGDGLKGIASYVSNLPPDSSPVKFSTEGYKLVNSGFPLVYSAFGDACFSWSKWGWLDSEKDSIRDIVRFSYECGDGSTEIGYNQRYIYGVDYKAYGLGDTGLSGEDGEFVDNIYRISISDGKKTFLAKNLFSRQFTSAKYNSDGQDVISLWSQGATSSDYQLILESGEIVAAPFNGSIETPAMERRPDWENIDLPAGYSLQFLE